jgi:hypothetical protein
MKTYILIPLVSAAILTACSDNTTIENLEGLEQLQAGTRTLTKVDTGCKIDGEAQTLSFIPTDDGFITHMDCFGQSYEPHDGSMVMIEVWQTGFTSKSTYTAYYDSIRANESCDSVMAYGMVTSNGGSQFLIVDTYTTSPRRPSLRLNREITVKTKGAKDVAFNSYLMIRKNAPQTYTDNDYYMPSLVFKDGSNLTDVAIGSDWKEDWILAREERMGLPITMMRDKKTGVALSITDYNLNPATLNNDWGNEHLSSNYFNYCSLGYNLQGNSPAVAYCYPGSEGGHTYSNGASVVGWSRRSTPVARTYKQKYTLEIMATKSESYALAQRDHWRAAFDLYSPEELDVDSKTVLDVSLQTLDHYWLKSEGAPGFPFSVYCSTGKVNETSFDMGFVGMQAACGYYLYRYGLDHGNETYRKKGEQVLDFWANKSANSVGMPRIWYDISPWNSFRNYNDLRNMQGGMEPMLLAWSCAEAAHPGSHPNWLKFCKNAAEWMLKQQKTDGSFPKAYDNNGAVIDNGTYLTSNILRFLTAMYGVTGKDKYRQAVVKAGNWCLKNITADCKYIGSVIDNPYVKDRESGQKMIEAMLACYDLTHEQKYLDAAQEAAYYTVSYMYAWNIPWENGTTLAMPWPKKKTTVGITIIATGHSGADCGFSYNSFEYLRLYILTGDDYFLRIARLLEKNTKQTMNYDGTLKYPYKGLQREAIRCVTHRGDGVELWLPWCTASALDPLFRMEDAYGCIGIDNIVGTAENGVDDAPRIDDSRYVRKLGLVRLPEGATY